MPGDQPEDQPGEPGVSPGAAWRVLFGFAMGLGAGLLLVLVGHQPVAGASAFVAPFLVAFERFDRRDRR